MKGFYSPPEEKLKETTSSGKGVQFLVTHQDKKATQENIMITFLKQPSDF